MLAPLLPSRWGPLQHSNSAVGFLEAGRSVLPEPPIPAMNGECVFSQGAGPCRCGPPCLTCERGRGPSVGAARGGDVQAQSPRAQDHGRRARPHRNASVTSLKRDFGSHSFMGTMSASQSYQVGKLRHRGLPRLPTAAGAGCGVQRGAGPRAWDSVLLRAPPASVQQPSDARAPATCPPPAAGPPGHCPARRPESVPLLCPGRWAGRQGQTPGILAGSRVAAVRGGPPAPPLCPGAPAGHALLPPGRLAVGQTLV